MNIEYERSFPTPVAQSPLLPLLLLSLSLQKHTPNTRKVLEPEYDYVIVGAGTAGSVLASRLSEKECVRIGVLEAGRSPPKLTEIPGLTRSFAGSNITWNYRSAPLKYTAAGHPDRRIPLTYGKAIGGSGVINGMKYSVGNRRNYDSWAAGGATGWSYEEVLPYFKKIEKFRACPADDGYHGLYGPISVELPRYETPFSEAIRKAAIEGGYDIIDAYGRSQNGFYKHAITTQDGQRYSAAKAYLVPAENRNNLDIVPEARVTKVLFDGKKAVGVEVDHDGKRRIIRAKKEVILSAGAVNTAQLLMLSGIGPKEHLKKLKIPVVIDLPVGSGFQEHPGTGLTYEVGYKVKSIPESGNDTQNILKYIWSKTGFLSARDGCIYNAFLNNGRYNPSAQPDHLLYFNEDMAGFGPTVGIDGKPSFGDYLEHFKNQNKSIVSCIVQLLNTRSRGTIRLDKRDPYSPPIVDLNFYHDPRDLKNVVEGLKHCKQIFSSRSLRNIGAKPLWPPFPGCEKHVQNEDAYFTCIAKTLVMTICHPTCTARMGRPEDPTTVCDPKLRVHGIRNLRIVDNSVMPSTIWGNTNLPAMMIAEKAADFIKNDIHCRK